MYSSSFCQKRKKRFELEGCCGIYGSWRGMARLPPGSGRSSFGVRIQVIFVTVLGSENGACKFLRSSRALLSELHAFRILLSKQPFHEDTDHWHRMRKNADDVYLDP